MRMNEQVREPKVSSTDKVNVQHRREEQSNIFTNDPSDLENVNMDGYSRPAVLQRGHRRSAVDKANHVTGQYLSRGTVPHCDC